MSADDYVQAGHDLICARWRHPLSGVVINDEDMPVELLPAPLADRELARGRSGSVTPLPSRLDPPVPLVTLRRPPDDAA